MDKLYIVMPAYNEAETIGNTINDWYPVIEKYSANGESRLLVIDDGSKDNTYHILCDTTGSRLYFSDRFGRTNKSRGVPCVLEQKTFLRYGNWL